MNKEELYKNLKDQIIAQVYKPEQVLNEKELMAKFDVGRTPLREVLFDLQREGLVSILPRLGTFVTPLSLNDLHNLMQVRPTLERLVVEILCDSISDSQLNDMNIILDKALKIISDSDGVKLTEEETIQLRNLEAEMHNYMYDATKNPYLIYICHQLQANSERYWAFAKMDTSWIIAQIEDHSLLLKAMMRRDKELCGSLAEKHATRFTQRILASLGVSAPTQM